MRPRITRILLLTALLLLAGASPASRSQVDGCGQNHNDPPGGAARPVRWDLTEYRAMANASADPMESLDSELAD
jgi:hypothetical protein